MWQHPPLATAPQYVQNGIDDLPPRMAGWTPSRLYRRHMGFKNFPLFVAQIGRVTLPFSHAAILPNF